MEAVLVAAIGALGLIVNTYISLGTRKAAENIDRKTETNHGRSPGQYLEMVMEVRDQVLDVRDDILAVRRSQMSVEQSQDDLHEALIQHTAQDSENFDQLAALIINEPRDQ